ncbi:HupE/UreJ family protein [Phycisphaerales bacterium AB-hyl4]|uniref:HupE/UreJ family protein n=1 Tax=Natronomicrosphaera hydrolytica TaxID=3242702 RepID=A0ABV4U492_9BACT
MIRPSLILTRPLLRIALLAVGAAATLAPVGVAWAHPHHKPHIHGENAFVHGLLHPITGLDHVLAMLAIGLWASQIGGRHTWAMPAAFVALMIVGGLGATLGLPLVAVEGGILASVLILGLLVAAACKLPLVGGAAVAGLFAIFHGYAHVSEMTTGASLAAFGIGFALASAALCFAGLGVGQLLQTRGQAMLVRACGGGIATVGLVLVATAWV